MQEDVTKVVKECDSCQKSRARFGSNKELVPTHKGIGPF